MSSAVSVGVAGLFIGYLVWWIVGLETALYAGLGVYWLGVLGMGIGYIMSPVSVRDEFEEHTIKRANDITSVFVFIVTVIGVPAATVLDTTEAYTVPPEISGMIGGYFLLIFIFAAAHWYVKRQY